jgi:hypothetical protein
MEILADILVALVFSCVSGSFPNLPLGLSPVRSVRGAEHVIALRHICRRSNALAFRVRALGRALPRELVGPPGLEPGTKGL